MDNFGIKIIGSTNECSCASNKLPLYLWRHSTTPPALNYLWINGNETLIHNGFDWISVNNVEDILGIDGNYVDSEDALKNSIIKLDKVIYDNSAITEFLEDRISSLENSGLPEVDLSSYITKEEVFSNYSEKGHTHTLKDITDFNIKTINGESVLGEGNIEITSEKPDLSEYAKRSELFSKDYNDLTNKPTIISESRVQELIDLAQLPENSLVDLTEVNEKILVNTNNINNLTNTVTSNSSRITALESEEDLDTSSFATKETIILSEHPEIAVKADGFRTSNGTWYAFPNTKSDVNADYCIATLDTVDTEINNKLSGYITEDKLEEYTPNTTFEEYQLTANQQLTNLQGSIPTNITDLNNDSPIPLTYDENIVVPAAVTNIHTTSVTPSYGTTFDTKLAGGYSGIYYLVSGGSTGTVFIVSLPFGWFGSTPIFKYPIKVHPIVLNSSNTIDTDSVWLDVYLNIYPDPKTYEPFIKNIYNSQGVEITSHNLVNCSLRGIRGGLFTAPE